MIHYNKFYIDDSGSSLKRGKSSWVISSCNWHEKGRESISSELIDLKLSCFSNEITFSSGIADEICTEFKLELNILTSEGLLSSSGVGGKGGMFGNAGIGGSSVFGDWQLVLFFKTVCFFSLDSVSKEDEEGILLRFISSSEAGSGAKPSLKLSSSEAGSGAKPSLELSSGNWLTDWLDRAGGGGGIGLESEELQRDSEGGIELEHEEVRKEGGEGIGGLSRLLSKHEGEGIGGLSGLISNDEGGKLLL